MILIETETVGGRLEAAQALRLELLEQVEDIQGRIQSLDRLCEVLRSAIVIAGQMRTQSVVEAAAEVSEWEGRP